MLAGTPGFFAVQSSLSSTISRIEVGKSWKSAMDHPNRRYQITPLVPFHSLLWHPMAFVLGSLDLIPLRVGASINDQEKKV